MSRGPGRVERAVEQIFKEQPSCAFTTEELAEIVYPGINRVEKKHRVAVLRAAYKVAYRLGWFAFRCERPGGHTVYCNPCDVRSYALGRLRSDFVHNDRSLERLQKMAEGRSDREEDQHETERVSPGGAWWNHVQIERHRRDGTTDSDQYSALMEEQRSIRKRLARM